jgi:hypothetical protein
MNRRFHFLAIVAEYSFVFLASYLHKLLRDTGGYGAFAIGIVYYYVNPVVLILACINFILLAHYCFGVRLTSTGWKIVLYLAAAPSALYLGILYQRLVGRLLFGT